MFSFFAVISTLLCVQFAYSLYTQHVCALFFGCHYSWTYNKSAFCVTLVICCRILKRCRQNYLDYVKQNHRRLSSISCRPSSQSCVPVVIPLLTCISLRTSYILASLSTSFLPLWLVFAAESHFMSVKLVVMSVCVHDCRLSYNSCSFLCLRHWRICGRSILCCGRRPTIPHASVNTCFMWCDISLLTGIRVKLDRNMYHVSGHC